MNALPEEQDVFKLMSVSPPRDADDVAIYLSKGDVLGHRFIAALQQHLLSQDFAAAQAAARAFLAEKDSHDAAFNFVLGALTQVGDGQLVQVLRLLRAQLKVESAKAAQVELNSLTHRLVETAAPVYLSNATLRSALTAQALDCAWATYVAATLLPDGPARTLSVAADCLRVLHLLNVYGIRFPGGSPPFPTRRISPHELARRLIAPICLPRPYLFSQLPALSERVQPRIRGVGDLKVVRKVLIRYAAGEIAHIENVLEGETRERKHQRTERREEVIETQSETTTQTEKDLQTTARAEFSQEVSDVVKEDASRKQGVSVSGSYGTVSVHATSESTTASARESSERNSRNGVRETISRAVERVSTRVYERRTSTTYWEIVESTLHTQTAIGHDVVGIYRWVDQVFRAQLYNYGARLMLEFFIPEPGAFLRSGSGLRKSTQPLPVFNGKTLTPGDITPTNYVEILNGVGVSPDSDDLRPLAAEKWMGCDIDLKPDASGLVAQSSTDIAIDGYTVVHAYAGGIVTSDGFIDDTVVMLGVGAFSVRCDVSPAYVVSADMACDVKGPTTKVTVVASSCVKAGGVCVRLQCKPEPGAYAAWQAKVFAAAVAGYAGTLNGGDDIGSGVRTLRRESDYRAVEREELKRWSLLLLQSPGPPVWNETVPGHMQNADATHPDVYFDAEASGQLGRRVQFYEEGLEWTEMTYEFYPYFWSRRGQWEPAFQTSSDDVIFQSFLQAGFARVLVPVTPAFECAILYLLSAGRVLMNQDAPIPEDEYAVALLNAISEANNQQQEGVPEGDSWEVTVPTTLVVLNPTEDTLPSFADRVARIVNGVRTRISPEFSGSGVLVDRARWPKDGLAVLRELQALGYALPDTNRPRSVLTSRKGRAVVRAFQTVATQLGLITAPETAEVGLFDDPATLSALGRAQEMRRSGSWPGKADRTM